MSYIGIGSPIPDISNLPGQTGGEVEVNLSYPSASACTADSDLTPTFSPAGGSFTSSSEGLVVDSSTGVIDISASTAGSYTITYTVEGVPSSFAFTLNQTNASSFSYSSSSFEKTGIATPNITGVSGGTFAASSGLSINNSTGVIDLAASTVGTYTVSYTSPGVCGTISTFQLSIEAVDRTLANTFSMSFDRTSPTEISTGIASSTFSKTATWSISAWCKATTRVTALGLFGNTSSATGIRLQTSNPGPGKIGFDFSMVGDGTFSGYQLTVGQDVSWTASTWYHVVITYDGSETAAGLKMYINNNASTSGSPDWSHSSNTNSTLGLSIGVRKSGNLGWDGLIDEFAIFDYALTSQQVQEIYNLTNNNTGKTANLNKLEYATTNPIAWYRMGD
tara:strand:+ start:12 stop:1187 length:1176 start_codon:yes stop_codon:yes gene_type:complete